MARVIFTHKCGKRMKYLLRGTRIPHGHHFTFEGYLEHLAKKNIHVINISDLEDPIHALENYISPTVFYLD